MLCWNTLYEYALDALGQYSWIYSVLPHCATGVVYSSPTRSSRYCCTSKLYLVRFRFRVVGTRALRSKYQVQQYWSIWYAGVSPHFSTEYFWLLGTCTTCVCTSTLVSGTCHTGYCITTESCRTNQHALPILLEYCITVGSA